LEAKLFVFLNISLSGVVIESPTGLTSSQWSPVITSPSSWAIFRKFSASQDVNFSGLPETVKGAISRPV